MTAFAPHSADEEPVEPPAVELATNPAAAAYYATWTGVRQQIAELKELEATCRQNLEAAIGDATEATFSGQPVITWRHTTSKSFDQSVARRFLTPEQWAACLREKPTRTFREVN